MHGKAAQLPCILYSSIARGISSLLTTNMHGRSAFDFCFGLFALHCINPTGTLNTKHGGIFGYLVGWSQSWSVVLEIWD